MSKTRHALLDQFTVSRTGIAFYYWDSQSRDYQAMSYDDLYQKSYGLAQELKAAGMSHQLMMVAFPQGLEFVQVVLACLMADVVFIPIHQIRTKSDFSLLESMARSTLTSWVLTPNSFGDVVSLKKNIGSFFLERLNDYGSGAEVTKDICFLQYSSGTTHKPKGVMISHDNLHACLEKMAETMRITPDDHGCVWLPPYQDLGIIGGIFMPLYQGFPLTLMSPRTFILNPLKWIEVMSEQQVTITAAPNFAYELCVDRLRENKTYDFNLERLRIALNGAELVKPRTLDRFAQAFQPYAFNEKAFYPAYGLTEATLMVSAPQPLEEIRRLNIPALAPCEIISCGKPMANVRVKIMKGQYEAKPLEVGEIWISGEIIAQGYWNDPQSTAKKFNQTIANNSLMDNQPYVKSGDLGFVDHEGYLYVLGRLDDQIILQDKVYLSEYVEDMVLQKNHQEAFYKTAAFQAESEGLVILWETSHLGDGSHSLMNEVAQDLHQIFGFEQITIALVKRGEIPVTTNGKIKRHAAQVLYQYGVIEVLAESDYTFTLDKSKS